MKDRSLFESLYTLYHPMVCQMCLGFLKGDRDQADDLAQEVFINVWNALEHFRGEASYKTWIYRITVNSCLQFIRKERTRREADSDLAKPAEDRAPDYHQELYEAIGQLAEIDRLVIMMVLEEMDYREIAQVVGITEVALRVRIHRIKTRLKKIMAYETRN